MRIAGTSSPNYHLSQPNQSKSNSANSSRAASDSELAQNADSSVISNRETQNFVTGQKGALMQASTKDETNARVEFYSQKELISATVWNAYATNSTVSPTPDNTNHKAKAAISEYLQTQYIEERQHFKAVLGIDDYA